ncbi:hypothetical protein BU16DRAFT_619486 [Lophium mytilinum]|uniref:Uncharacterized protein n=1 Tax=Lophium mytilinum TaxID=390894 RepID=A0A6A6QLU4_9PEZI|nr:hypothetical protein BU16DRAFT_619486 [Lophium mytilinum]
MDNQNHPFHADASTQTPTTKTEPRPLSPASTTLRPHIVILDFHGEPTYPGPDHPSTHFNDALAEALSIQFNRHLMLHHLNTPESGLRHLQKCTKYDAPIAVLIADSTITKPGTENRAVAAQLGEYVQNGGIVVLLPSFSQGVVPQDLNHFFSDGLGLTWKYGRVVKTEGNFKNHMHGKSFLGLQSKVEFEGIQLASVPSTEQVYLNLGRYLDASVTPVAWGRVGRGVVGYCCASKDGIAAVKFVVAMCSTSTTRAGRPELGVEIPERWCRDADVWTDEDVSNSGDASEEAT